MQRRYAIIVRTIRQYLPAIVQVGAYKVGSLAASGTSASSINLTAPSNAGTYYYGACVGTVSGEINTNNNCSTGAQVTVAGQCGLGGRADLGQQ